MWIKRGQESAAGAASLVALIGLFVLLFVVFLPPAERAKILDDTTSPLHGSSSNTTFRDGQYILLENPGSVIPPSSGVFSYSIAPVEISSSTEAMELETTPKVVVRRTLFSTQQQDVDFTIDEPDLVAHVLLSFNVKTVSGTLLIKLNGREIANQEFTTGNIEPILLPSSALREHNLLEFHAQPVGAAFWSVNSYNLDTVKITADVKDISKSIGSSTFYIPPQDLDRMRAARLLFLPSCTKEAGVLNVALNGVTIINTKPVCGSLGGTDFSPDDYLLPGNNKIKFSADEGAYAINRIRITSEPKDPEEYVYFFKIPPRLYDDVYFGDVNIIASLKFARSGEDHEGKLVTNGFVRSFDVKENGYALDISDFIEEGFNSLELIADEPLTVVELRVDIE